MTLWTVAHQAPLSKRFSRQEYWSGLPCSPPGDLLDPGIEPVSLVSPALVGGFFTLVSPGKLHNITEYPSDPVCSFKGLMVGLWQHPLEGVYELG